MKRLLLVFVALALAMLACQPNGPTPEPVVIVVTATPAPMKIAPTPIPVVVPPTVAPSLSVLDRVDALFVPRGFERFRVDENGENSCGRDYCIHYTKDDAVGSFYVTNEKFMGIVVAFPIGSSDATINAAAEFTATALISVGIPVSDQKCTTQIPEGQMEKTCGSIKVRVIVQDIGGQKTLFFAYNPTANSGQSL